MTIVTTNQEIAPWRETRWLTLSSLFFLVPAIYGYFQKVYFLSNVLVVTSLVSANYWRKCTYGLRRNMDLVVAKIAFGIFLLDCFRYVRKPIYVITGYPGIALLGYCYHLSGELRDKYHHPRWLLCHFLFHVLLTYEQFLVIDSIFTHNALKN